MAIGTTAAILGSAVIGAGASAVAAGSNSKAINQATEAQTEGNAASLALQERVFNTNRNTLDPFVQRGNQAGGAINALLGLGGQAAPVQQNTFGRNAASAYGLGDTPGFTPNAMAQMGSAPSLANQAIMARDDFQINPAETPWLSPEAAGRGNSFAPPPQQFVRNAQPAMAPAPQAPQGQSPQQAAENAFDIFRNSTGYQFRVSEAQDALNSGFAGSGLLQSGAALRSLDDLRQNMASAEFNNYMGLLSGQQGTGLQAAGAQAGVGVNYANSAAQINAANSNALSNAAVARANNSNAMIGGIGNAFGDALGALAYQPR